MEEEEDEFAIERERKRRRNATILGVLALFVTCATCFTLYYTDTYQGLPLDKHPCEPEVVEAAATDGWSLQQVEVDGATLVGLVKAPRKPERPWVLYFAGNADYLLRGARAYAELLLERRDDFGFASFAYRGFDTSTGQAKPGTFQADARAVFDHLVSEHGVSADRLHVVGFSLGASAAALLAEDLVRSNQRLASTSLLSPGMAPPSLPPWLFPVVIGAWEMGSKLTVMPGPVLIVAARDDEAYPLEHHAKKMPPLLGDRLVDYVEVDGRHDMTLNTKASLEAVRKQLRSGGKSAAR